ncbi:hypothetical protein IQ266_01895 [filamentous cyanobacterium LEGE 11480]|uniref:Uncharacterized protein n=1 Tax=Romeriopsis navalis LEGE 11480 TaxID=2777977 RepID=A0A928VIR3_9CYAN|nr:hypothetical protein [Romeriopsis navalis]MBE9028508.1 hypothetical protein [Romeriopsis navalis LEGE 11480]
MNIHLNHQETSNFTMSLSELEAALDAALNLCKAICQRKGMESKEYLRAWRMAEEVKAEIMSRCSSHVCPL